MKFSDALRKGAEQVDWRQAHGQLFLDTPIGMSACGLGCLILGLGLVKADDLENLTVEYEYLAEDALQKIVPGTIWAKILHWNDGDRLLLEQIAKNLEAYESGIDA